MLRRILLAVFKIGSKIPFLAIHINRLAINRVVNAAPARPYPFSLWSPAKIDTKASLKAREKWGRSVQAADYTSWRGLVDRSFSGRHLPPADPAWRERLPAIEAVTALFKRETPTLCPRSSVLLCFFAQWFTDSILRTDSVDKRRNTSNHEIDLCQIYGLKESTSDLLRAGVDGKLRSELVNGDAYGERIYGADQQVKPHFKGLPYVKLLPGMLANGNFPAERLYDLYASGLERGNTTIVYSALGAVFRREHNRLCDAMKARHGSWDDDRLFQTARNCNITMLLKIIVEDYILHLSDVGLPLKVEVGFAERQKWYRTNRITIEFDLLYRWHGLVPDTLDLDPPVDRWHYMYNNALLEQHGVERVIRAASKQRAGRASLGNTPDFLVPAEAGALALSRQFLVRPYNEYRQRFGQKPVDSFLELTGDAALAGKLEALYPGGIGDLEFFVGLFAEKRAEQAVLGGLTTAMVALDAFSQALTNPLLSGNVYGADTFSETGLETIESTSRFEQMVRRNCGASFNANDVYASFSAVPRS